MLLKWERAKATFNALYPVEWITQNFYIPERMGPITLEPYQRACLREALRREDSGDFVYSLIVWSDIKKSAKSTIAAAVALWMATARPYGSVRIVANDLKQADSRVAYYLRRSLELNPETKGNYRQRGYQVTLAHGTTIEAVPVDPKGEAGGGDDAVFFSELWAANQKAALAMWTETTLSPLKFGQSFRWVETYAGYSGESELLEMLYEQGVRDGQQLDLGIDGLEVYANPATRMFCLWNTQPRCEWQTPEYYAQEAAVLLPKEFQRVHRNQWVTSTDAFIDPLWWAACYEPLPDLTAQEPLVVGVDAATTNDSFAIVGVTRHMDPARRDTDIAQRLARIWTPPLGGQIDYSEPEAYLRWLVEHYNVVEIAYDRHQLVDMMQRLGRERISRVYDFSQGELRLTADKGLRDLILRQGIAHDGNPALAEHLKNADAKTDSETRKLRIVKRAERLKIDAAVALSMAAHECLRLNM